MPLASVKLRPGINTTQTETLNEGGWSSSQLIRFKDGLPQKMGGWQNLDVSPIYGTPRALHAFADLSGNTYLAVGTNQELLLESAYGTTNITPYKAETNNPVQFTTTAGSAVVEVQDAGGTGLALTVGDWVDIVTPVAVGGIIVSGLYPLAQVSSGGAAWRITAASVATANVLNGGQTTQYTTVLGSDTVTVTLPNHGLWTGDAWTAALTTVVGGVTISGTYTITFINLDNFSITATTATSSAAVYENAGDARIQYKLGNGLDDALANGSYGAGPYGFGPYGSGASIFYLQSVSLWSLDNWGEQLVANRYGAGIYVWAPPVANGNSAIVIPNSPTAANQIFVAMPARILVALGAETIGIQDPLLVRWSDVEDYTVWTAAPSNQAGSFRLGTGNYIVAGLQGAVNAYLWTDVGLWEMKYLGPPYVFGFSELGRGCGLIGPHAVTTMSDDLYWMSQRQFYKFDGRAIQEVNCPVWDEVFQNLTEQQASKITAGANSFFGEVWWFYPSKDSTENDSYIKYNTVSGEWDYGLLDRTAWIDQSVLGAPIGADSLKTVAQHETGNDESGLPMNAWVESGYFMISEGDSFTYVDQIIPDIKFGIPTSGRNGTVLVTIKMVDYPTDEPRVYGPFPVNKLTNFVSMRARGRQMALRFESQDLGSFWRVGNVRYRGAPAGRR